MKYLITLCATMGMTLIILASCSSCQSTKSATNSMELYTPVSSEFNADSAYAYIEKQAYFGPRVPNTEAHKACGDYLVMMLKKFGAQVIEQKADITHYNGMNLQMRNIIGSYQPEKEKRILLAAHWDSRPFADQERDSDKQKQSILGVDDGASGVGVLLEIARQLQQKAPEVGVDIIFFDLEDWGQAEFDTHPISGNWWCLGSQYWAENPHVEGYKARFGILLDMVGAAGAVFPKEGYSLQYASNIVENVWSTASKLGYGSFFIRKKGTYITDDHVAVNEKLRAPMINIIHLKDTPTGFVEHWHTLDDTLKNINKNTLKAVGQTVLEVVYSSR